jgi:Icc-related predicted phosphoesterase
MGIFGKKTDSRRPKTTIFFATDVHGSDLCFKKFVNAAKFYEANILILGGDVTGKMVVPIARQPDGGYRTTFAQKDLNFTSDDELERFQRRIRDMGFYPKLMSEEELQKMLRDKPAQDRLFRELIVERLREWIAYADPRLESAGVQGFWAPGNDDFFEIDQVLDESRAMKRVEGQVVQLDGYEMLTTGFSNHTPWHTEREMDEGELKAKIESMATQLKEPGLAIYNLHVPPLDSKLDECAKLDDKLQPISDLGNPVMFGAGSSAVREVIESHQPLLGLHGHIHEGRGEARLGRTLCLNPGSNYSEGILNGCLLTLQDGKVADLQFTTG